MTYFEALMLYKSKNINKTEYFTLLRYIIRQARTSNYNQYKIYVREVNI